jgi:hypothetical protein
MSSIRIAELKSCGLIPGCAPLYAQLLPALHAILACPQAPASFPVVWTTDDEPTKSHYDFSTSGSFLDWTAVWETPYYILHTLLGWSDPAKGLLWWYRNDFRDHGDRRLQILKDLYLGRKPMLDYLAAWLWWHGDDGPFHFQCSAGGKTQLISPRPPGKTWEPASGWFDNFRRIHGLDQNMKPIPNTYPSEGPPRMAPSFGGSNGLHLAHLLNGYGENMAAKEISSSANPETRTAHLVLAEFAGWHRALVSFGDKLPPIAADRSWRIHVTVAPIGYLGEFRRSRVTGIYFQGEHSLHMQGNTVLKST